MNCKPGCLAVRVRKSCSGLVPVGALVETIRLCPQARLRPEREIAENVWDVRWNGKEVGFSGFPLGVPDVDLKMIGNPDGQDETLSWKEVPAPSVLAPKPQREFVR